MIFETEKNIIPLDKVLAVYKDGRGAEVVLGPDARRPMSVLLTGKSAGQFMAMYREYHHKLDNPYLCGAMALESELLLPKWVCFSCGHEFGPDESTFVVIPRKNHKQLHNLGADNHYCRDCMVLACSR